MSVPSGPMEAASPTALVVTEQPDRAVVLAVSGELGYRTIRGVRATLVAVVANRPALVVIDLLGVSFLDSAGLALLIEAVQACGSEITLRIVAASPITLRPIQLTGLHGCLELHATVADALTATGS